MKRILFFCLALMLTSTWAFAVGGETCATATVFTSLPYTDTGNTCNFHDNLNVTCDGTGSSGKDVVYSYTSPVYQRVAFSLCGSGYNTKLYIFDGGCTGSPIGCNENSNHCGTGSTRSYIDCLWLYPGHTYYIVVDGRLARDEGEGDERCDCGNYTLNVTLCGTPPYTDLDMGDLPQCNYPTLVANPAHGLSGIAWLGANISPEATPNYGDADLFDDGVEYLNQPWHWCEVEQVRITVTGGEGYNNYAEAGGQLYLNGWKDGNLDGDFCDEIPCIGAVASEWIVQDLLVSPALITLDVIDPGVDYLGVYDGVFRWRLTSRPVGRYGFGLMDTVACNTIACGTFDFDFLGEVEDYVITDLQLAVELGNFEAISGTGTIDLRWNTLSESQNDHFEIIRNGNLLTSIESRGETPTGYEYAYTDAAVEAGTMYTYVLWAVDINGGRHELATTSATPRPVQSVITEYALHQNYPNPFNPTTKLAFDLVESGFVSLKVYNMMGQEVATVVNSTMPAGAHSVVFNAAGLPSGTYWYRLDVNGFSAVRKMVLTK